VGVSQIRYGFALTQATTGGFSNARLAVIIPEPLIGGFSKARLAFINAQVLFPAEEDRNVSNNPFPGFGNSTTNPAIPAAADPFNTPLPGLDITVKKVPRFKTRISEGSSGFEVRNAQMQYPRWDFELSYNYLEDRSGAESSLKVILGFFLARQGSFESWLFKDPDDYLVTNGVCGIADGVTTEFPLCRTLGDFREQVGQLDTVNTLTVYVDGLEVDETDYEVVMPNSIVFNTAPDDDLVVSASFQFYYACRFIEDGLEFEKFMDKLWNLQSVEFRSIIQ
jgi:uncharacterized protein (TIGR02217 family)